MFPVSNQFFHFYLTVLTTSACLPLQSFCILVHSLKLPHNLLQRAYPTVTSGCSSVSIPYLSLNSAKQLSINPTDYTRHLQGLNIQAVQVQVQAPPLASMRWNLTSSSIYFCYLTQPYIPHICVFPGISFTEL